MEGVPDWLEGVDRDGEESGGESIPRSTTWRILETKVVMLTTVGGKKSNKNNNNNNACSTANATGYIPIGVVSCWPIICSTVTGLMTR